MSRKRRPAWARWNDDELLDLRICDLGLRVEDSVLPERMDRVYAELERRGIRFRPHYWLSEEWFSPDGIPGIAIPFYLAHPRLFQLEHRQMYEVEGGTQRWCMQLMRHEAGHAIDTAYGLHRRKSWREMFGTYGTKYPEYYRPRPFSRRYVLHLDWWYAQAHPAEDFAETFAVWLTPGSGWRTRYADWPAHKKLAYVDGLMKGIAGKPARIRSRKFVDPVSGIRKTLREYYREKRERYQASSPEVFDRDLARLFTDSPANGRRRSAAAFLRRVRPEIRRALSRGTGEHSYSVDHLIKEMIVRCRENRLYVDRPEPDMKLDLAVLLSVRVINYLHSTGRHWIPL